MFSLVKKGGWFVLAAFLTVFARAANAMTAEYEYQLDAYYTAVDCNINFSSAPIPYYEAKNELDVYRELLLSSHIPRQAAIEASVNPLPILGVYLKKHSRDFYNGAETNGDANIIRSVTTGFEEPAALSLFLGNMIDFKPIHRRSYGEGKGYMGTVLSVGGQHIKDNVLISDKWIEGEWKLKGERNLEEIKHHWSFRIGGKFHDNPNIADVYFFALRRSRTDYNDRRMSFLKNSGFSYKFDFSAKALNAVQHQLIFDKKFPMPSSRIVPTLSIGFEWRARAKYTGALRNREEPTFLFLFQPNIEF